MRSARCDTRHAGRVRTAHAVRSDLEADMGGRECGGSTSGKQSQPANASRLYGSRPTMATQAFENKVPR